MTNTHALEMLKTAFDEWQKQKVPRMAAAIAFYAIFSVAPILVIAIAVSGLVFGKQAVQGQLMDQMKGMFGTNGAEIVQYMISKVSKFSSNVIAAVVGGLILIIGATGVFVEMQDDLNTIWEVKPKPAKIQIAILETIRTRLFSFGLILAIGFLLIISLVINVFLEGLGNYFLHFSRELTGLLNLANHLGSFVIFTLLFALIFKHLPDVIIPWKDIFAGAILTAALFSIGKALIGLYLGQSSVTSEYGAAGSLVIVLLWFNYTSQILFFGAEFTKVFARRRGSIIAPKAYATSLAHETLEKTGTRNKYETH